MIIGLDLSFFIINYSRYTIWHPVAPMYGMALFALTIISNPVFQIGLSSLTQHVPSYEDLRLEEEGQDAAEDQRANRHYHINFIRIAQIVFAIGSILYIALTYTDYGGGIVLLAIVSIVFSYASESIRSRMVSMTPYKRALAESALLAGDLASFAFWICTDVHDAPHALIIITASSNAVMFLLTSLYSLSFKITLVSPFSISNIRLAEDQEISPEQPSTSNSKLILFLRVLQFLAVAGAGLTRLWALELKQPPTQCSVEIDMAFGIAIAITLAYLLLMISSTCLNRSLDYIPLHLRSGANIVANLVLLGLWIGIGSEIDRSCWFDDDLLVSHLPSYLSKFISLNESGYVTAALFSLTFLIMLKNGRNRRIE
jgi:hypothetical protein